MASSIHVDGADKIRAVAQALRHLGTDRTIAKEMAQEIRKLGPAVRKAIRDSARSTLPKRGGLNRWVAAASILVKVFRSDRRAGINIVVGRNSDPAYGRRSDIRRIDLGTVRSPLYGNREHWYPHAVTPGFATNAVQGDVADKFAEGAEAALDRAVERVLDVL